jgi:hypothetical protein
MFAGSGQTKRSQYQRVRDGHPDISYRLPFVAFRMAPLCSPNKTRSLACDDPKQTTVAPPASSMHTGDFCFTSYTTRHPCFAPWRMHKPMKIVGHLRRRCGNMLDAALRLCAIPGVKLFIGSLLTAVGMIQAPSEFIIARARGQTSRQVLYRC